MTSLNRKAIMFIECKTSDICQDHAVVFLPYQRVIVCRNKQYIPVHATDFQNTWEITEAMKVAFGFTRIRTAYFVAIQAKATGYAEEGTSHIDGDLPACC